MKNLTKLSLITASLMLAGNAFADDGAGNDSDKDVIKLLGHVPPRCNIQLPQPIEANFEHDVTEGRTLGGKIGIFCNSKSGAKLTLAGKGLTLDGDNSKDHQVNYQAWWGTSDTVLEIDTATAPEDTGVLAGSKELAMGMVDTDFSITLTDSAKFAGYYTGKVVLAIEAN